MPNCTTVRRSIAEADSTGALKNLPVDVRAHVNACPNCAEMYYGRLDSWECPDVRAYTELNAIHSLEELPPQCLSHVERCSHCCQMLTQIGRLCRMMSNVTLRAAAISCPTIRPKMLRRPVTWKLALALAVFVFSLGALAFSIYRTAERWGWLYTPLEETPSSCPNSPAHTGEHGLR